MKTEKREKNWLILRNKMANCEGTTEICLKGLAAKYVFKLESVKAYRLQPTLALNICQTFLT